MSLVSPHITLCTIMNFSIFHLISLFFCSTFLHQSSHAIKKIHQSLYTARDVLGHGTPTLSIAGGNFVSGANVFGFANGTAKGGSPRSHVAAYKVCWLGTIEIECTDADIIEAFEDAISDGVDIISCSLGKNSPTELFEDGISIGAFHAIENGVMVVTGGGNSGPKFGTVTNLAPWLFSVGASTIDRSFVSYLQLGDNKHIIMGTSLSTGLPYEKFYSLISSVDAKAANATIEDAQICEVGTLDPNKVKGKILFCLLRELNGLVYAEEEAVSCGAIGLILGNDKQRGNDIMAYPHLLPTSHINYTDAEYVYSYIEATKTPMAYMSRAKTEVGVKPAPVIASLSSRGPNPIQPIILKPDISAPGVDILYAYIGAISPTGLASDNRRIPYIIGSGTSVACPHVSGIVSLLKTLYPHWTPAAFKSAIMTTARVLDNNDTPIKDQSKEDATPFGYGAGHIQPELAMDPGLVYDLNIVDYLNFLCSHGYNQTQMKLFSRNPYTCPKSYNMLDFNYPSITVPNLRKHSVEISRTVTNVGSPGTYHVHVKEPHGISVLVKPRSLTFDEVGEKKTFKVIFKVRKSTSSAGYVFGHLLWSDGRHKVMSPLVVRHN